MLTKNAGVTNPAKLMFVRGDAASFHHSIFWNHAERSTISGSTSSGSSGASAPAGFKFNSAIVLPVTQMSGI